MRNAYGAMWIFAICLIFTILMTAFLAISINYAKAFRIKSYIVSSIEEHEGYSGSLDEQIHNYFYNQGYDASGKCENYISVSGYDDDWELQACIEPNENGRCGACVYRIMATQRENGMCAERARYRVVSFFKFDFPVVRSYTTFQVAGESRYIFDFANSSAC